MRWNYINMLTLMDIRLLGAQVKMFNLYTERQKVVGTKPLNPKTKNHRTRPYQSLLNTYFSLLYSHEGYPKQLTIHNSRMIQHSLRYYCNSALLKLYTHNYLHSCLVTTQCWWNWELLLLRTPMIEWWFLLANSLSVEITYHFFRTGSTEVFITC